MKTQIITLESHDDLISVRDRMSWAKTPRILLVIPKFEKISLRHVDYKILQRHASMLGAQVGLVTRVRKIRAEAEALGIPVFESTGQAQREVWSKARRRRWVKKVPDRTLREQREQAQVKEEAWRAYPVTRIVAFAVGVLSVLAIVALFIPRAQVTLQPIIKTQSVSLTVNASPAVNDVFITGSIPIYDKRIVVDGIQTITVTGVGTVPQSRAKGDVEFHNLTQQAVTVPDGTVVSVGAIQFETTEEVVVPAGVGKTITASIQAVEGGSSGNVDAELINSIEGRLGLSLSVTNPEAITGGRELASVQASDADRTRAKNLLLKTLQDAAQQKLVDELHTGDVLFEDTITLTQTLSEKYDPPPGAVGTKLTVTMQAEFSAQYASASDITQLARLSLNAALPSNFHAVSDDVTVTALSQPYLDQDGSLKWNIRAKRDIVETFDSVYITDLIQGHGVKDAQSNLDENLPTESKPALQLSPVWWRWVPLLPFRIGVVTQ